MILADVSLQLKKVADARGELSASIADACDRLQDQFPDNPQLRLDLLISALGAPIGLMMQAFGELDPTLKLRPDKASAAILLEVAKRLDVWVKEERKRA